MGRKILCASKAKDNNQLRDQMQALLIVKRTARKTTAQEHEAYDEMSISRGIAFAHQDDIPKIQIVQSHKCAFILASVTESGSASPRSSSMRFNTRAVCSWDKNLFSLGKDGMKNQVTIPKKSVTAPSMI